MICMIAWMTHKQQPNTTFERLNMTKHLISEKSAFAPVRFQATRPWWKPLGKLAAKADMASYKKRSKILSDELHPLVLKAVKERLGVRDPRIFQNESILIQSFGGFLAYGRVIYELSEALTDNLAVTDFDDVTQEDLELQDGTVYLHFGDHPALHIDGIQYEGAFVSWKPNWNPDGSQGENLLSICPIRHNAYKNKPIHYMAADLFESLPVFFKSPTETIKSAIAASRVQLEEQNKESLAQMEQIKQKFLAAYGVEPDISGALETIGLPSEDLYKRMTSICLAVLSFLAARPDDIESGWPADAPSDKVERVMSAAPVRQEAARRELENDGYVQVRYVGAKFADSADTVRFFRKGQDAGETKRTIATHPRRGYFRRQPCGPGRKERRIKYIAPTIVNPGGKIGHGKIISVG